MTKKKTTSVKAKDIFPPKALYEKLEKIIKRNESFIIKNAENAGVTPGANAAPLIYNYNKKKPNIPALFIKKQTDTQKDDIRHEYSIMKTLNKYKDVLPVFAYLYEYNKKDKLIITELVKGDKLSSIRHKLNVNDNMTIFIQIIYFLWYAGEKWKYAHNDLHSSNIMVRKLPKEVRIGLAIDGADDITFKTKYAVYIVDQGRAIMSTITPSLKKYIEQSRVFNTKLDFFFDNENFYQNISLYVPGIDLLNVLRSYYRLINDEAKKFKGSGLLKLLTDFKKDIISNIKLKRDRDSVIVGSNIDMKTILHYVTKSKHIKDVLTKSQPDVIWGRKETIGGTRGGAQGQEMKMTDNVSIKISMPEFMKLVVPNYKRVGKNDIVLGRHKKHISIKDEDVKLERLIRTVYGSDADAVLKKINACKLLQVDIRNDIVAHFNRNVAGKKKKLKTNAVGRKQVKKRTQRARTATASRKGNYVKTKKNIGKPVSKFFDINARHLTHSLGSV